MVGFIWWGGEGWWSDALAIAGVAVISATSWAVRRRLWAGAVSHFDRRPPVGPERTLIDQYRSKAAALSWVNAGLVLLFCLLTLWFVDFRRPADFLAAAKIGFALAGILGLGLLKVLGRRRLN